MRATGKAAKRGGGLGGWTEAASSSLKGKQNDQREKCKAH